MSRLDVVLRVGDDFREGEDGIVESGPLEPRSKQRRFSQVRGRWAEGVCTVEGAGEEGGEDSWKSEFWKLKTYARIYTLQEPVSSRRRACRPERSLLNVPASPA